MKSDRGIRAALQRISMKAQFISILLVMLCSIVCAYSDDNTQPGAKFVGTWDKVSGNGSNTITIENNGDQFLIIDGSLKTGAIFKDGFLMIGDTTPITHIISSDHITFIDGSEYARRNPATSLLNKGFSDMLAKKWDEALVAFTAAIKADPNNSDAYMFRASVYAIEGDYESEISDYEAMSKIDPTNGKAYFLRGCAYCAKGDYQSAIHDFTVLIYMHPTFIYGYEHRGKAEYAAGRFSDALTDFQICLSQTFDKSTNIDPDEMYVHYFIWLIEIEQTHQADASNAELTKALKRFPGADRDWPRPIGHYLLGEISEDELMKLAGVGSTEAVKQQICQANYYVGMKHFLNGDPIGAKPFLQKSIDTDEKENTEYQCAKSTLGRLADASK
jgi:lipoprotein NlpI